MRFIVSALTILAVALAVASVFVATTGRFASVGYVGCYVAVLTATYGIIESWRSLAHRRPLLLPLVSIVVLSAGLLTAISRVRYELVFTRQSADTRVLPESRVELPPVSSPSSKSP